MIRTVFLDLDDTILDFGRGERKALCRTLLDLGINPTPDIVGRYVEINIGLWRAFERREVDREEVLVGRFRRLFSEFDIEASAEAAEESYEKYLAMEHDFLPGALQMLEDLYNDGRYSLYMATNGNPAVQWPRIKDTDIGKYFKDIFISYDFGVGKPSREFFERCFERIEGFRADEAIIIGDSLTSDIKGGINAGIKTCHFNHRNSQYNEIVPDYEIKNLLELKALIDSIE